MPVFIDQPPRTFEALVRAWLKNLSPRLRETISYYDVMALVDRLEVRLDDVIRPLAEFEVKPGDRMTTPEDEALFELPGAVGAVLLESAALKRERPK